MIKINGVEINPTIFPDKTSQVWQLPAELLVDLVTQKDIEVVWTFQSEAEVMHLCQLSTLLQQYCPHATLTLKTNYWPYARQDKEVRNDLSFARQVFESIIAGYYDYFSALDLHSPSEVLSIDNRSPNSRIAGLVKQYGYDHLVFPDAGAKNRYGPVGHLTSGSMCMDQHITYFRKVRDQKTGKIEIIEPQSDIAAVNGKSCMIIDDICDGGGTFCGVAECLRNAGTIKIGLFCTHALLTKGTNHLFDSGIDQIFSIHGLIHERKTNG
jgi:ribose-phosphate pyrophosphokinase